MITAKGHNGQVTFDGNFITISRKGGLARMTVGKGEKRIPITSVTAVQWKPPGGLVNGFIQFTVAGSNESRSRMGHQTMDAVKDENSVIVLKKQAAEFEALRSAIEDAIVERHQPQQFVMDAPQPSKLDQLTQLGELRDSGVLSPDEFEDEKARIMGGNASATASPAEPSALSPVHSDAPASVAVPEPPLNKVGQDEGDDDALGGGRSAAGKAGRIAGAVATGGLSEVGRFAIKRRKDKD